MPVFREKGPLMSDPGIEQPPLGVPDDPHTDDPGTPPPGDPGLSADLTENPGLTTDPDGTPVENPSS